MCVIVTCALVGRMILWSLVIWSTFSILKIQFSCLTYSSSEKKSFFIPLHSRAIPCDFLITFPPSLTLECEMENHSEKTNFSPLPVFNVVKRRNLYIRRCLTRSTTGVGVHFSKKKTFPLHFTNCFLWGERKQSPFIFCYSVRYTHSTFNMTSLDTFGERIRALIAFYKFYHFYLPHARARVDSYSRKKNH